MVYTYGAEKDYRIWDAQTGEQTAVLRAPPGVKSATLPIALAPDSRRIAWAEGSTIYVGSSSSGDVILTLDKADGHKDDVSTLSWSKDGELIASSSFDGSLRIWNPESGKLLRTLKSLQGFLLLV